MQYFYLYTLSAILLSPSIHMKHTNKELIEFYFIVFFLSWAVFLTIYFYERISGIELPREFQLLAVLGVFSGTLISCWRSDGKEGVKKLLRRCIHWKINWKWYLVIFIPMILISISIGIVQLFNPFEIEINSIGNLIFGLIIVTFFMLFGEEIAWRGYALPKFQRNYSALKSSLISGFIWGAWHFPIWLIEPERAWGLPFIPAFLMFIIGNIAFTVLYAFITNSTKGSILLCALFHASGNVLIGWLKYSDELDIFTIPIYTVLLVILSFILIIKFGSKNLSKTERFLI